MKRLSAPRAYYLLEFGQALAFNLAYTLYTVYLVQEAGLNPLQLALVGTALEITYFLFEIPTGVVADVYSRRLSIVVGLGLLGVGLLLTGATPVFLVILIAQVVMGIGYTFMSGATTAWLAGEVGETQVGVVLIRAGQAARLGSLLGIGASVAVAGLGLSWTYLLGGGLMLVLCLVMGVGMPEQGFRPVPRQGGPWAASWRGFRAGAAAVRAAPLLLILCGVEIFMGMSQEGFDRLGQAHFLENFTFPSLGGLPAYTWFAILGVAGTVISLVVVEPLRPRLERLATRPGWVALSLLVFDAVVAVASLVFVLTGSFWLAAAASLVRGVGFALGEPMFAAWLAQNTQSETRATAISTVGLAHACGEIGGGPLIGSVSTAVGLRVGLGLATALLLPALPFYLLAARRQASRGAGAPDRASASPR
jgi:DHA3 family tetracycline resistance protein-like MFS transporter